MNMIENRWIQDRDCELAQSFVKLVINSDS